jgi:hypothetical protein
MSVRNLISREELDRHLTSRIREIEDLEDAKLRMKYVLAQPDASGCNWSSDFHLNAGTRGSLDYAIPLAREIVEEARAKFNVKD